MGTLVPGILRHSGDVPHLAALIAPRRLVIAGGVTGANEPLDAAALDAGFAWTRRAYELEGAAEKLSILPAAEPAKVVERLR